MEENLDARRFTVALICTFSSMAPRTPVISFASALDMIFVHFN